MLCFYLITNNIVGNIVWSLGEGVDSFSGSTYRSYPHPGTYHTAIRFNNCNYSDTIYDTINVATPNNIDISSINTFHELSCIDSVSGSINITNTSDSTVFLNVNDSIRILLVRGYSYLTSDYENIRDSLQNLSPFVGITELYTKSSC